MEVAGRQHVSPGIYAPSGFDVMKILYHVATRPNPVVDLGPVDVSCPMVLCDLFLPDTPAVYVSDSFLAVTGYARHEILGRNCRFLQYPPNSLPSDGSATPRPPLPAHLRQLLHDSIAHNQEAQVEVANFRKDGSRWVNVLSIVPILWDDDASRGGAEQVLREEDARSPLQWRYRYAVGFVCDKGAMGL